jgi:hypothetical protein
MGKSALRLVAKMARIHPVVPRPDKNGIVQPPYMRSATAVQSAPRIEFIKSCIRSELTGKVWENREQAQKALSDAAKRCSAKADEEKLPKLAEARKKAREEKLAQLRAQAARI